MTKRAENIDKPSDRSIEEAAEVAAMCETAAQYLLRLKEKANGTWGAMALEDLADMAIDIKTAAKEVTGDE